MNLFSPKRTSLVLSFFLLWISPYGVFAECGLDTSAPQSITKYTTQTEQEITEIHNKLKQENKCTISNGKKGLLINLMQRRIDQNTASFLDGEFRNALEKNWEMKQATLRDLEYFEQHEKKLKEMVREISASCKVDGWAWADLVDILLEHREMETTLKRTALGKWKSVPEKYIRSKNLDTWDKITRTYHPSNTINCESTSDYKKKIQKSQVEISRIWWDIEDALEWWKKWAALFRGGNWMSSSEYLTKKREILMRELGRQGAVHSTRQTILNNFDCFKAKTADYTQTEEVVSARVSCLSNPVAGLDKDFLKWKNYTYKSKNFSQITNRAHRMMNRKKKNINVAKTYGELVAMTSSQQDIDENTLESLVTLHINLMTTNKLIEDRIAPMQKNCMKGQPWVVGGCRH